MQIRDFFGKGSRKIARAVRGCWRDLTVGKTDNFVRGFESVQVCASSEVRADGVMIA